MPWHKTLPKTVRVGCVNYSFTFYPCKDSRQYESFGETESDDAVITLRKSMTTEQALNTVIHEILHAVWHDHAMSQKKDLEEEYVVTSLANGLSSVIATNPKLAGWLKEHMG